MTTQTTHESLSALGSPHDEDYVTQSGTISGRVSNQSQRRTRSHTTRNPYRTRRTSAVVRCLAYGRDSSIAVAEMVVDSVQSCIQPAAG